MVTKYCLDCEKPIFRQSTRCRSCSHKGELNSFYGKTHSEEVRKKISIAGLKENPTYSAIHLWVKTHKGSPKKCEHCGTTKGRLEWANKDHKYRRILDDFFSLCCKCHYKYDKDNGLNTYTPKQDKTGKFISARNLR